MKNFWLEFVLIIQSTLEVGGKPLSCRQLSIQFLEVKVFLSVWLIHIKFSNPNDTIYQISSVFVT